MKRIISALTAALMLALMTIPALAQVNGIFLGSDENGVNILNDLLRPGEEYCFPVLIAVDGAPPVNLTAADIEGSRLKVRVSAGGNAVESVTVEEKNGLAYVCVTPGGKGTTQTMSATLRVNYVSRESGQNVTVLPELKVGYSVMSDDRIAELDPGEFLETDNQNPIVVPAQWDALSELNDYREVTLHGNGWRYTVNTANLGKRNMLMTHDPVMELVKKYPDRSMHFVGFPGAPDFEVGGKLTLDVSELAEEYDHDFYLYRCAYGKLYPLKYSYDRDAAEITIRPTQLSTYLITDRAISLDDNTPNEDSSVGSESISPEAPGQDGNPNTGSTGGVIVAYIAAMVSLAGLGIMTSSKRRP